MKRLSVRKKLTLWITALMMTLVCIVMVSPSRKNRQ